MAPRPVPAVPPVEYPSRMQRSTCIPGPRSIETNSIAIPLAVVERLDQQLAASRVLNQVICQFSGDDANSAHQRLVEVIGLCKTLRSAPAFANLT